jgi:hypothetical protein
MDLPTNVKFFSFLLPSIAISLFGDLPCSQSFQFCILLASRLSVEQVGPFLYDLLEFSLIRSAISSSCLDVDVDQLAPAIGTVVPALGVTCDGHSQKASSGGSIHGR